MGQRSVGKTYVKQAQRYHRKSRSLPPVFSRRKVHFSEKHISIGFWTRYPLSLVINIDQAPLSCVNAGKYTFSFKDAKNIPIKGMDDKRQITASFAVSCTGEVLPIELIYAGKSERSLSKYSFPPSFSVTFTENNWSNTEKFVEFFKEIIFPCFEDIKRSKSYPLEQHALIIMATFKGKAIIHWRSCVLKITVMSW